MVHADTVRSLMQWQYARKYASQFVMKIDTQVEKSRNKMVKSAVEMGATHLMFIDSDMVFGPNQIDKLVDRDLDIVGGIYYGRMNPIPQAFRIINRGFLPIDPTTEHGPLVDVAFVGAGFLLIKMSVFKRLEPPFFRHSYEYDRLGIDYPGPLLDPFGEDVYFGMLAREAGVKVYCDIDCEVGHVGYHKYTQADWVDFKSKHP